MNELTIIIPHYNSSNKLIRLLKSIPDSFGNIGEVIVVDDYSEKEHLKILNQTVPKLNYPIKVLKNRDEKGAGNCRNIGIDASDSRWLMFADSDDYFIDNFCDNLMQYFNSSWDIVYFRPTSMNEKTKNVGKRHVIYEKLVLNYSHESSNLFLNKMRFYFVVPWSKLYRSSYIKDNKFYFENTLVSNDVIFSTLSAFETNRITCDKSIIYCVTECDESLMGKVTKDRLEIRIEVFLRQVNYVKNKLNQSDLKKLDINGFRFIKSIIKNRLGIDISIKCIKLLSANKINVFPISMKR